MAKRATDQTFIVRLMGNISIMFLNDEKQFNNDILKCVPSKLEKNNLAKKFNSGMVKEGNNTINNIYININILNNNINNY